MNYSDLLYFDGPNTLEEVTHQRDLLGAAIAEVAYKAGIYNCEVPVSTEHLLTLLNDLSVSILAPKAKEDVSDETNTGFFGSFKPFPPTRGFEHLTPAQQGICVDGWWKDSMQVSQGRLFEAAKQGLDYDGARVECGENECSIQEYCDVKFLRKIKRTDYKISADVFISHNEYNFGRKYNTVFEILFLKDGLIRHLTSFTFQEAKELGAMTVFGGGNWVTDRHTGKEAAPWCIDILAVRPEIEHLLVSTYL